MPSVNTRVWKRPVGNAKVLGDGERRGRMHRDYFPGDAQSKGKAGECVGREWVSSLSRSALIARRSGEPPGQGSVRAGGGDPACSSPRAICSAWPRAPGPAAAGRRLEGGRRRARAQESAEPEMGTPSDTPVFRRPPARPAQCLPPPGSSLTFPNSPRLTPAAWFLRAPYLPQNSPGPRRCLAVRFPRAACGVRDAV